MAIIVLYCLPKNVQFVLFFDGIVRFNDENLLFLKQ
jgi:hypothetical protein